MSESPPARDDEPAPGTVPGGVLAPPRAGTRPEDHAWPESGPGIEIRTASIRLPGVVALLLAIAAFLLFGLVAIMLVVAGAVGALLAPWMLRRMLRLMEAEVPSGDVTVELDHSSYSTRYQERSAIKESSSSRRRGNTSV